MCDSAQLNLGNLTRRAWERKNDESCMKKWEDHEETLIQLAAPPPISQRICQRSPTLRMGN